MASRKPRDVPSKVRPTGAELGILRVLWRLGAATVHEVHAALSADATVGYTTVLKLLQIMHQKGLVERDDRQRAHVYRPVHSRDETQRVLTRQLIESAFDGSRSQLVLHALSDADRARPEELAEIRALLDRLERGSR
ncbi:MAG TPA: BlaI/MecI/CopY family transcriptional regulator [Steroidobacteraceae bacterium]|nr:BlaI/MecI/CopY family transcriptional regulator [Steroidobacteraceae bacterium]